MTDAAGDRQLPRPEIEELVRLVRPDWQVRTATLATEGVTPVYRLGIDGPTGSRTCYYKAARGEDDDHPAVGDVSAEARLLAVLHTHTDIPVPTVVGVVDDHDAIRSPAFLMTAMEGPALDGGDVGEIPDGVLAHVARQTGRHLGQLHDIDFENVTTFGRGVHRTGPPSLSGGRPDGDPAGLTLTDGHERFADLLRDWWADDFDEGLVGTRFEDLIPVVRSTLLDRLQVIPPADSPVVARLDHGFHNLLVDSETGDVSGVLDWGTLAAFTPAYDLALVELRLTGGPLLALPDVPDRRDVVRDGLLAGYREERAVPDAFDVQRRCYQLDVCQSWLASLADDSAGLGIPGDRVEETAQGFRALVDGLVE